VSCENGDPLKWEDGGLDNIFFPGRDEEFGFTEEEI